MADLTWQPSLLDAGVPLAFDATYVGVQRLELTEGAWVDHQPGWLKGADELFAELLDTADWASHTRHMYDQVVVEPRLTTRWRLDGTGPAPPVPILAEMAASLSDRYGVTFTQVGANLYRDGRDSVAWHGDRVARELPEAIVALVVLGAARPFRLRPKGGGRSVGLLPGRGDLLVMGGSCQRTWDHAVPKVRQAGPRISIQFRHAYDR
jgi:alkylated DNA repair dioxygenase AlkB